jgi:thiamine biosynthesis lipoprotein
MRRRDLFHPRHLARAAAQVVSVLDDLRTLDVETPPPKAALLRFARRAMATTFEVLVPFGSPCAPEAAQAALDEIDRLEAQLSVFREDSEVSRLNRLAAAGPVAVEPALFALLEQAARLSRDTAGSFDITTGALTKTWGFFRRQGRVPAETELAEALAKVGMAHIALNPDDKTVEFLQSGLEINLGSIGKGYALDRAADHLRTEWCLTSALLHGGHSSIYALGSEPGSQRGWTVGLRHPWDPARRLAIVHLRDRAVGTSAVTFQHFEYNGRKLGHILDPRRGWPAEGIASASVIAPTAAEADALATAFYVLGVEPTRAYCAGHAGVGAVLLPDGEAAQLLVIGLDPQDVELVR